MSSDLAQRDFIKQRDHQMATWFAEGHLDADVLDRCIEHGYDLSLDGVAEMRADLYERTLAVGATMGRGALATVKRAHQAVRVRELDMLADQAVKGIKWCVDNEKYNTFPKVAAILLQANRQIGEEVHDLEPAAHGTDTMEMHLSKMSVTKRTRVLAKMAEVRAEIDAPDIRVEITEGEGSSDV